MSRHITRRRVGAVAATAAAALVLAGCASDAGDDGSGLTGEPVKIGFLAPLTGSNAGTAEIMVNAAELAVEHINDDGGIGGRPLELVVYDDELSPDVASQVATRAITTDEVVALVGGFSSPESLAIREVAERSSVPYLAVASTSAGVTKDAVYSFRVAATALDQANATADIANTLGLTRLAIVYDNGAVGPVLRDLYTARAESLGIEIVSTSEYSLGGTDVLGPVSSIAAAKPDGVLVGGSAGADYGLVAKAMVELGIDAPMIGVGALLADGFNVGEAAYQQLPGIYQPSVVDTDKAEYTAFIEAYAEAYGDDTMDFSGVASYDAMRIVALALAETEGEGGDALAEALEGLAPYTGISGRAGAEISFAQSHDGLGGEYMVAHHAVDGKSELDPDIDLYS